MSHFNRCCFDFLRAHPFQRSSITRQHRPTPLPSGTPVANGSAAAPRLQHTLKRKKTFRLDARGRKSRGFGVAHVQSI